MSDPHLLEAAWRAAAALEDHDRKRHALQSNRDAAIRGAYATGSTIAELSRAAGLTRAMLYRILDTK